MKNWPQLTSLWSLTVVALGSLALCGCGGTYDSGVSGVVKMDGSPLPSGSVSFIPDQTGPTSYGVILNDGSYQVSTGRELGLPSGGYTVTVVAREKAKPDTSGRGLPPTPGKSIAPPWYGKKASTPLKFDIQPGSNEIDLELTSEPPPNWSPPKPRRR